MIVAVATTLSANEIYEVQLLYAKSSNPKVLSAYVQKGTDAGLVCESRQIEDHYVVRCDRTSNYKEAKKSLKKAKKANIDYCLKKLEKDERVANDNMFTTNDSLVDLFKGKKRVSKPEDVKKREEFLEKVKKSEKFNGLYLKAKSSRNFDKNRYDYNTRIEWEIFDDGFFESKKSSKRFAIKKGIEYDNLLERQEDINDQLSIHKLISISNNINYIYLKQQKRVSSKIYNLSKKKFDESLITINRYLARKDDFDKIKRRLNYYQNAPKESFDSSLKDIIKDIENVTLEESDLIISEAYSNSLKLRKTEQKIELLNISNDWTDKLKVGVFAENRKYDFLDDSDSLVGVDLRIPLDFSILDKKDTPEFELEKLQKSSTKNLIAKDINDCYNKIEYQKEFIQDLKSNISLLKKKMKTVEAYPENEKITKDDIVLAIINEKKNIWLQRVEIVKNILKIQKLSGVKVI
jgi:hypothetical protein